MRNMTKDTKIENAKLNFKEKNIIFKCNKCKNEFEEDDITFICPECDGHDLEVISGKEFYIESIEVKHGKD